MKKSFDAEQLEKFVTEVFDNMPPAFSEVREECQRNFRSGVEAFLNRMDLVSREDYEIQTALLEKLRRRVEELEQRLDKD